MIHVKNGSCFFSPFLSIEQLLPQGAKVGSTDWLKESGQRGKAEVSLVSVRMKKVVHNSVHDKNQKPSFMADCSYCKPHSHIALLNKSNVCTLIFERINYFHFVRFTELITNRRFLRATENLTTNGYVHLPAFAWNVFYFLRPPLPKKKYEGLMHSITRWSSQKH
jgi:hypothetical protein